MQPDDQLSNGFDLGPFQVFPRKEQIVGPEDTHHLEPKVMQVLVMLASNAQQPVTRDELLDTVWAGTVVGDEVLSRAVSLLRGYLKDERTNPTFIRTLPKQGYELIQPVAPISPEQATAAPTKTYWLAALVAGLVLAIGAVIYWNSKPAPQPTIAVLPFQVPEELQHLAFISEGITDQLTTHLSTSSEVNVVARRSSFAYRDPQIDASAMGDLLGASHLVEGSIYQAEGSSLNGVVYLVDVESGTNVWSVRIEADTPTVLRERVVTATLQAINDETSAQVAAIAATPSPLNPEAYRAYLEAKYQWSLRGELRIDRAISLLKEAIELEPTFGAAHLASAHALAVQPFYTNLSVPDGFALARASAALAVGVDSTLSAEVAALEGFMLMRERRWSESLVTLQKALALDSESVLANFWYSTLLCHLGRPQEALAYIEKASRLDPASPVLNDRLAVNYLWVDDLAAAANRYDIANKLGYLESTNPKSLFVFLNRTERFEALSGLMLRLGNDPRWVLPFIAGLENAEQRDSAISALEAAITEGIVPNELRFGAWVFLEDADRAFRDFDHDLKTDDVELLWAKEAAVLRAHPNFPELLDQLGLSSVL